MQVVAVERIEIERPAGALADRAKAQLALATDLPEQAW